MQPLATTVTEHSLLQVLLARAVYDNHPDCADELAFSRGDILTIVEQNVPESEGWWKCMLHGKQGLAPANRLQVLQETLADRPCPLPPRDLDTDLSSSEAPYQVPNLFCPPLPGPVYEPMKSWVEGPPPATAQVYELPDLPSSARIICEKTLTLPKQVSVSPNESTGKVYRNPQGFQHTLAIAVHQIKRGKQDVRALLSMTEALSHFIHILSIPVTAYITNLCCQLKAHGGVCRSPHHREGQVLG